MKRKRKVISLTKSQLDDYMICNPKYAKEIEKGNVIVQLKLEI